MSPITSLTHGTWANLHAAATATDGRATIRTSHIDRVRELAWPSDFAAKVPRNEIAVSWLAAWAKAKLPEDMGGRFFSAMEAGDPSQPAIYGGEAVGPVEDLPTAAATVACVAKKAAELLANRATAFVASGEERGMNWSNMFPI